MPKKFNLNRHNSQESILEVSNLNRPDNMNILSKVYCSIPAVKLLTSISFVLISYSLFLIAKKPAVGYELSIYASTPLLFWISVFFGLVNGIFLLSSYIYNKKIKLFYIGLFEIVLCNFILVTIHALRNYSFIMGRGDNAYYTGYAQDINVYGHIFDYNFYPYTSVLVSQISQVTGISSLEISKYIISLFFTIYILSVYCWAKSFKEDRKFVVYSTIAATPLFFAWFSPTIYHMLISTLILPLLFFVINNNSDTRYGILVVIFCLVFPFTHPITSVLFLLYLISIFFVDKYLNKDRKSVSSTLIMIFFISSSVWYIAQYTLSRCAVRITEQVLNVFLTAQDVGATSADLSLIYVNKMGYLLAIKSFIGMTFDEIMYYIISLFSIFYIIKYSNKKLLPISVCFIMGNLFFIILFFFSRAHTPYRFFNMDINIIFTPLLVGYAMKTFYNKYSTIFHFIIVLCVITAALTIYQSPFIERPNDQFTSHEISGAKWLLDTKNSNISSAAIMSPLIRYSSLIYGYKYTDENLHSISSNSNFPMNFSSYSDSFIPLDTARYFMVTDYDIEAYSTVWKDIGQFKENEINIINSIKNGNKIYNDKQFSIYLFYPEKTLH